MKLMSTPKKFVPWAVLGVVFIVAIYLVPAISKLFGSLSTVVKSAAGAVNTGVNSVAKEIGLDQKTDDDCAAILAAPLNSPWNPQFYQQYFDAGQTGILTSAAADQLIAQIHVFQSPMKLGQADEAGYEGMIQSLPSQCHFSSLCYFWQKDEGTALATWMNTGWLFGAVCAMGDAEMVRINQAVLALPVCAS